ncbi:unnamed protein product [Effrenium voratum]|uniref:Pyridine nucleotide-disulphide oxidoreductase N-terminal domain-containing protein n=1 Tax=Effrenium voratum TaxID=2562239 RepID=A0AA36MK99_9DINO|nr:unnamed protein product [Effrenium voratum]CAJ1455043.1 unnamed protein product [Effrenium voratum]
MAEGRRMAIIGAGPIGLELALGAAERGFQVELFERKELAGNVRDYGFVRLFSPWSLNMSDLGKSALQKAGYALPPEEAYPTGQEYLEAYLQPLAAVLQAHDKCKGLHCGVEVLAVGRGALLKGESIGGGEVAMPHNKPLCARQRSATPFRLLVREVATGQEKYFEDFDIVADCSGFYDRDLCNWVGKGGLPALGERALRRAGRLWTAIPHVLGQDRGRFAKRKAMVIGAGMSAATTLRDILELAKEESGTEVVLVTRSGSQPYSVIPDDVLPQRKALCELGNQVAAGQLTAAYVGGAAVQEISEVDGRLQVLLQTPEKTVTETVDELVCCVGYHPDTSVYEELQVHQCYASNGPIKLAATLIGGSGDCLKQVAAGADTLKNPEPNFFILGSKSYGRKSSFLLKIGHEQVRSVLDSLA